MTNQPNPSQDSVFHPGEVAIHRSLGIEARLHELGQRMIRDYMPDQHRDFFSSLPMIHLGVVDEAGHPHAFVRFGKPGFISSPDEHTLIIESRPVAGEPDDLVLNIGAKISVVGVEFSTRRRNRLNATITAVDGEKITLSVGQSYGNCPKYIQVRTTEADRSQAVQDAPKISQNTKLTDEDIALIENTDTLFIASRSPRFDDDPRSGVDVNHRGGRPGFVQVQNSHDFYFPDYLGNNFFNTLGNISVDPRVGVQFFDFESGTLLNVSGQAHIAMPDDEAIEIPDMGRRVWINVERVVRTEDVIPFDFAFVAYSPMLPTQVEPSAG